MLSRPTLVDVRSRAPRYPALRDGLTAWWNPGLLSSPAADQSVAYLGTNDCLVPELVNGNHGIGATDEGTATSFKYLRHGTGFESRYGAFPYRETNDEAGRLWEAPFSSDIMPGHQGTVLVRVVMSSAQASEAPGGLPGVAMLTDSFPIMVGIPPNPAARGQTFGLFAVPGWGGAGGGDFYFGASAVVSETPGSTSYLWGASTGLFGSYSDAEYDKVSTTALTWDYDGVTTGTVESFTNGVSRGTGSMLKSTSQIAANTEGLVIGGAGANTAFGWKNHLRGGVLEVVAYDRVLSDAEIMLYHQTPNALAQTDNRRFWRGMASFSLPELSVVGADDVVMTSNEAASTGAGTDAGTINLGDNVLIAEPEFQNLGGAQLTGSSVVAGDFTAITNNPGNIAVGFSSTPAIALTTAAANSPGVKTGTLTYTHDDTDESPFIVNYTVEVLAPVQFTVEATLAQDRMQAILPANRIASSLSGRLRDSLPAQDTKTTLPQSRPRDA